MNDRNVHHRSILNEWHEKYEKTIDSIFEKNEIRSLLDIGANTGAVIEFVLSRHKLDSVYAFEPDPMNFQILSENMKKVCRDDIHCELFNNAVYYGVKKSKAFGCNDGNPGGMFLEGVNEEFANAQTSEITDLIFHCSTLEEFLLHVKKIDLCKIDVEGSEWNIIENSSFINERVDHILLEHHWLDANSSTQFLNKHLPHHEIIDLIHNTFVMRRKGF